MNKDARAVFLKGKYNIEMADYTYQIRQDARTRITWVDPNPPETLINIMSRSMGVGSGTGGMEPSDLGSSGREKIYNWPSGLLRRPGVHKIKKLYIGMLKKNQIGEGHATIWEAVTDSPEFRNWWCKTMQYPKLMFDIFGQPMEKPESKGGPVPDDEVTRWADHLGIQLGRSNPCPAEEEKAKALGRTVGYYAIQGARAEDEERRNVEMSDAKGKGKRPSPSSSSQDRDQRRRRNDGGYYSSGSRDYDSAERDEWSRRGWINYDNDASSTDHWMDARY